MDKSNFFAFIVFWILFISFITFFSLHITEKSHFHRIVALILALILIFLIHADQIWGIFYV